LHFTVQLPYKTAIFVLLKKQAIMATINFLYRSTKDKANLIARLLFRHEDKDFVIGANTKKEIEKKHWQEYQSFNPKTKDAAVILRQLELQTELSAISNHILEAFSNTAIDEVNKEWLQIQIDYYYSPPQEVEALPTTLIEYFSYFLECKKYEITKGTEKKYRVTKHLLERYQATKKGKINIADVNEKFKSDFRSYCKENNYADNTISKDLRTIKTVCNHAKYNGLKVSHQLSSIKTPNAKVENIYLTFKDLEKIEKIDKRRLNDNYDNAKDWLLISCYTGQRVSDFMRFDKSMIRFEPNKEGNLKPLLEFTQVKTGKEMTIALHPKVTQKLEKRNGNFPKVISDSKYNLFIKQICRIAEINEMVKGGLVKDLTEDAKDSKKSDKSKKQYRKESGYYPKWQLVGSHIGRRSFASNFYGTIPTSYLANATGHSTEALFLGYIGKSKKDIALEVANYF
jgi:site-specific recombinase XerD